MDEIGVETIAVAQQRQKSRNPKKSHQNLVTLQKEEENEVKEENASNQVVPKISATKLSI